RTDMSGEQSLCSSCGNPRLTDLEAFIAGKDDADHRCVCDFLHIGAAADGAVAAERVQLCAKCCKRINEGRSGRFTQWIFRSDLCGCESPLPREASVEAISRAVNRQRPQSAQKSLEEESELAVDPAVFPLERFKPIARLGTGAYGEVWK